MKEADLPQLLRVNIQKLERLIHLDLDYHTLKLI